MLGWKVDGWWNKVDGMLKLNAIEASNCEVLDFRKSVYISNNLMKLVEGHVISIITI